MVAFKKPFLPKKPFSLKYLNFDLIIDYAITIGLFKMNQYCIIFKKKVSGK